MVSILRRTFFSYPWFVFLFVDHLFRYLFYKDGTFVHQRIRGIQVQGMILDSVTHELAS